MKIGIVSDTHGCVHTWRRVFSFLQDADLILHAGDVLYHGPRNTIPAEYQPAELVKELNSCPVPLVFAAGNEGRADPTDMAALPSQPGSLGRKPAWVRCPAASRRVSRAANWSSSSKVRGGRSGSRPA